MYYIFCVLHLDVIGMIDLLHPDETELLYKEMSVNLFIRPKKPKKTEKTKTKNIYKE